MFGDKRYRRQCSVESLKGQHDSHPVQDLRAAVGQSYNIDHHQVSRLKHKTFYLSSCSQNKLPTASILVRFALKYIIQGMVDGYASKPALRQETGYIWLRKLTLI